MKSKILIIWLCLTISGFSQNNPVLSISDYNDTRGPKDYPVYLFNIDTLNYEQYYNRYDDFGAIWESAVFSNILAHDYNNNGKAEIYSFYIVSDSVNNFMGNSITEYTNGAFERTDFPKDSLPIFLSYGDIENDGLQELVAADQNGNVFVFTQLDSFSLPTEQKYFISYGDFGGRVNAISLFDINEDGTDELIYHGNRNDSLNPSGFYIWSYDSEVDSIKKVFYGNDSTLEAKSISCGDFDQDGKMNVGFGSLDGYFHSYEYQGDWEFTYQKIRVASANAYCSFYTDDIDKNGKPELWLGAQTFSGTFTRSYETVGDDQYEPTYEFMFNYFSFNVVWNVWTDDLDGDGEEELLLCTELGVVVYKLIESGYRLDYIIENKKAYGKRPMMYGGTSADLDGDGYSEVLLNCEVLGYTVRTQIYKPKINPVSVKEAGIHPTEFAVSQNYPNPFNPSTKIRVRLAEQSNVVVRIYNMLGEEVIKKKEMNLSSGEHEITLDMGGEPTGVYIYQVISEDGTSRQKMHSGKMTLLK